MQSSTAARFDESSLISYLVEHLEPLTEADPAILAEYVAALLKKDKPLDELRKLCADNLVEFLGNGTESFVAKLFEALEDGSIARANENLDATKKSEPSQSPTQPSQSPIITTTVQPKISSPEEENFSTSSEPISDSENKVTDDEEDDRNHKHRKREAHSNSVENNVQEQITRQPNRKRSKPDGNGQLLTETNPQSNETRNEHNLTSERDTNLKFEKHDSGITPLMRPPAEPGSRTKVRQTFSTDPGAHFDLSTATGRPSVGRGRGRSIVPWGPHDSRFNTLGTLDFAAHMTPQGSAHPNLLMQAESLSAVSTHSASWGAFAFIPRPPNGILDPFHPSNWQGTIQPTIGPPLNLGMPRQHCRDFEERGFCLRGDICPMEHGANRIVVEDVQSLSQFNLPASIPSSQTVGVQAGTRPLEQTKASTVILANNQVMPNKCHKTAARHNALKLNGVLSAPVAGEADVYDPDQPLWNDGCPDAQGGLLKLSLPNSSAKHVLDADSSERQSFRISDETSEQLSGNFVADKGSRRTTSSVWGRIGSGAKQEIGSNINDYTSLGNETKVDYEDIMTTDPSILGKFPATGETGSRFTSIQPIPRPRRDFGFSERAPSQKAERTLFVNRIPQNINRPWAILSHFRRFGDVIDIYIPMNSENAFVQFSKKEEAEAALKAPDAVMGNRFIRVWWANRDRIPEESSSLGKSVRSPMVVGTPVPSQLPLADRGKESLLFEVQKQSSGHVAENSSCLALPNKNLAIGSKSKPPVLKKMENLNLLEELRKKQEAFDHKRDEFRRQLAKFEKQAILTKKGEADAEQAVKRHKGVTGKKLAKTTAPKSADCSTVGAFGEAEKLIENSNPVEIHVSPISEANLTTSQQSSKNIKMTSPLTPQLNRFKLDNRPTSFRILPPLPAEFTEIAVLKDHFSSFGDLASVMLEESNAHIGNSELESSQNCSACVTFTTRHSAEKAYINGKFWQGHSLQFMWLTVSPSLKIDSGIHENLSHSTHIETSNAKVQYELVTSGSSSLSTVIRSGDSMDVEGNIVVSCVSEVLLQTSDSSPTTSCEKCIPKSALPVVEDKADVNFAQ